MKVHTFGNTFSPAVATFGVRKTAQVAEPMFGSHAIEFVENDFYVDDGLKSVASSQQAIDLLQRTQAMLATANFRLNKISSNDPHVMNAFPLNDRAADLRDIDPNPDSAPIQRSLGVAAPVLIRGKSLLRSMTDHLRGRQLEDWDQPLPQELRPTWNEWCKPLIGLQHLKLTRPYTTALNEASRVELHTFRDASVQGIAAVAYLKITQPDGQTQISFVFGKAKLAPPHATTIPQLELCAACWLLRSLKRS